MQNYSLKTISKITNGTLSGKSINEISLIQTDSRNIDYHNTSNSVFFAIKGVQNDGHQFIPELYNNGVKAFVISENIQHEKYPKAGFIKVKNCIEALQSLASYKRNQYKIPIIGITGSNGKTIVKEWLFHLLMKNKNIIRSPQSYNSQIGVPLSLWLLDKKTDAGIFEAGISKTGEMDKLQKIINPEIGVFTNLGNAHQQNFNSLKQKVEEKAKLFKNSKAIIFPADDKITCDAIKNCNSNFREISWSYNNNGLVNIISVEKADSNSEISINYNNTTYKFKIPFVDKGSIENSVTCFCTLLALDITPNDYIIEQFAKLPVIEMRLEILQGINNSTIINDSYNSDINSLKIALDYQNHKKGNKNSMVILSDILQSQDNEEILYSEVADLLKSKNIDKFIGIGKSLQKYKHKFEKNSLFYNSTGQFIKDIRYSNYSNFCILLKGARSFEFEKIGKKIQQKTHETYIEVNFNAIKHNLEFFKKRIGRDVKIMAVVKAFSYGSGYQEIALFLEHNRIDYLAVAYVDEGVELRKHGVKTPIMVMNPAKDAISIMIEYNLEPEIYSFSLMKDISEFINKHPIKKFRIHLKLDTGMHRLGINSEQIESVAYIIKNSPKLNVISIFSHLIGSDRKEFDNITNSQVDGFLKMYNYLSKTIMAKPHRHILNSAGIIRFPEYSFEMVRLGIGLYGVNKEFEEHLIQVSTFKTSISQIHQLEKGETVSYNASGKINKKTKTATIPVGYADGLDRKLGNENWEVIVNNQKAKIIGDICMDMCIININSINAKEGDEVIIFGEDNPVSKMAEICNTIPYEIITRLSERVKRVYVQE